MKSIVFIGAGNAANQLAIALFEKGCEIRQVYSLHFAHAQELASLVKAQPIDNLAELNTSAEIYLLAVKDSAVAEVASQLNLKGKIVAHVSGVLDLNVLKGASGYIGVFYPLQSLSKGKEIDWKNVPFCIEAGDVETRNELKELAGLLTEKIYEISSAQREILHVAAVFTNNFVNHLLSHAKNITDADQIPFDILKPLALETIQKAFETGPENAQTGPAIRGDFTTLNRHKELLRENPEALSLYEHITSLIQG